MLSPRKYYALKNNDFAEFPVNKFKLNYDPQQENLQQAIVRICADVETSVRNGTVICILSDHDINEGTQPIHSFCWPWVLCTIYLIEQGLRCDTNIVASTGYARDSHQVATLIGCGASLVYPYLSYHVLCDLIEQW